MYDFVLQLFLVSSLALIVYLLARALPRVEEEETCPKFFNCMERWFKKLPLAKIDNSLNNYFEKTLRKARVVVMKADNAINKHLNNRKNNNGADNGSSSDLIDQIKNGS